MTITLRSSLSRDLTASEVDANFTDLNTNKASLATLAASGGSALVGTIQSGTGAVSRTVQQKLRDSTVIVAADFDTAANFNAAANANGGALAISQGATSPGLVITEPLVGGSTKPFLQMIGMERGPGQTRYSTVFGGMGGGGNPGMLTNGWITVNGSATDTNFITTISGESTYMFGVESDVGTAPAIVVKVQAGGDFIRFYNSGDLLYAYLNDSGTFHTQTLEAVLSVKTLLVDSGVNGTLGLQANGVTQFVVSPTASSVNFWAVTGNIIGNGPTMFCSGSDTNINGIISSKGTGVLDFFTAGTGARQVRIAHTASATRFLQFTGSNGGNPTITTSAGNLAITPAIVGAASSGNALGIATSSTTVLVVAAGTTGVSSLRIPHGAAPTSPVDGDMWTTTSGLFVRINGSTVGPLT